MSQNARGCDKSYNVVKVFAATKARDREEIGERVTQWIRSNPDLKIIDKCVSLSSDSEFHCLSIVVFCERN